MPIRVELPSHLRQHARIPGHEVALNIPEPVTLNAVLTALELSYPTLRGTIRDHTTGKRRDFLRFFACQEDISLLALDAPLPSAIADGSEPLLIIAGIAGG
jgi:hypothetical protein